MDIDYKKIFDSVFENANSDEIGCILKNELVPFDYCLKAMKRKGIGWKNKVIIAKRKDCPSDIIIKLCKNGGERFTRELLERGYGIPEDAMKELFKSENNISSIMQYWDLSDDIRHDMFKYFNDRYYSLMVTFLEFQCSIPEDCWHYVDETIDRIKHSNNQWDKQKLLPRVELCKSLMMTPINEDVSIEELDKSYGNFLNLLKIASNPSISDYLIMELKIKTHDEDMPFIDMLLNRNEEKREKWRKEH